MSKPIIPRLRSGTRGEHRGTGRCRALLSFQAARRQPLSVRRGGAPCQYRVRTDMWWSAANQHFGGPAERRRHATGRSVFTKWRSACGIQFHDYSSTKSAIALRRPKTSREYRDFVVLGDAKPVSAPANGRHALQQLPKRYQNFGRMGNFKSLTHAEFICHQSMPRVVLEEFCLTPNRKGVT